MFRLYSPRRTEKIIRALDPEIHFLQDRYRLPAACVQAILYQEMTHMDALDLLADGAVRLFWLKYRACKRLGKQGFPGGLNKKRDSSTGYAQIFGTVGIRAVEFAVEKGIESREALGLPGRALRADTPEDLQLIWRRLRKDPVFNLRLCALNLLFCAQQMTGRTDFSSFGENEMRLIFTRYNANASAVTAYGRETYAHFLRYSGQRAAPSFSAPSI